MSPISAALAAEIGLPVRSISIAILGGTDLTRGTIGVVQNSPIYTPGVLNVASGRSDGRVAGGDQRLATRGQRMPLDPRDHRQRYRAESLHDARAPGE